MIQIFTLMVRNLFESAKNYPDQTKDQTKVDGLRPIFIVLVTTGL